MPACRALNVRDSAAPAFRSRNGWRAAAGGEAGTPLPARRGAIRLPSWSFPPVTVIMRP